MSSNILLNEIININYSDIILRVQMPKTNIPNKNKLKLKR